MITFEWSWFAFVIGVVATLTVELWVIFLITYRQWAKQRKQSEDIWSSLAKVSKKS
jgi:hypothetical protein